MLCNISTSLKGTNIKNWGHNDSNPINIVVSDH